MLLLATPLRAIELGAGPATVGPLLSAPFWFPMLFTIPLGRLVSRVGAKRTMTIGAIGFTLGPWLALVIGGPLGLLATQLIIGLMQIFMGLCAQAIIATLGVGEKLERNFGWYTTCVSIGQLLSPLAASTSAKCLKLRATFKNDAGPPFLCFPSPSWVKSLTRTTSLLFSSRCAVRRYLRAGKK